MKTARTEYARERQFSGGKRGQQIAATKINTSTNLIICN